MVMDEHHMLDFHSLQDLLSYISFPIPCLGFVLGYAWQALQQKMYLFNVQNRVWILDWGITFLYSYIKTNVNEIQNNIIWKITEEIIIGKVFYELMILQKA